MRKVSDKQAQELKAYTEVRKVYMEAHQNCEICGKPATDLHHRKGRGIYLSDPTWFMAVCRICHDASIHGDPKTARSKGWLLF